MEIGTPPRHPKGFPLDKFPPGFWGFYQAVPDDRERSPCKGKNPRNQGEIYQGGHPWGAWGGYLFPTNFLPRFFEPYETFLSLLIIHLRKKFTRPGRKGWRFMGLRGYLFPINFLRRKVRGRAGVQGREPRHGETSINFYPKLGEPPMKVTGFMGLTNS